MTPIVARRGRFANPSRSREARGGAFLPSLALFGSLLVPTPACAQFAGFSPEGVFAFATLVLYAFGAMVLLAFATFVVLLVRTWIDRLKRADTMHRKQGQGALPPGPPPKAEPLETGPGR